MAWRTVSVPVDPTSIQVMRNALDEPVLAACKVEIATRLAIVTLNVTLLPAYWPPGRLWST
jgi:hypothetical protein